jgi:hypothetical protein
MSWCSCFDISNSWAGKLKLCGSRKLAPQVVEDTTLPPDMPRSGWSASGAAEGARALSRVEPALEFVPQPSLRREHSAQEDESKKSSVVCISDTVKALASGELAYALKPRVFTGSPMCELSPKCAPSGRPQLMKQVRQGSVHLILPHLEHASELGGRE